MFSFSFLHLKKRSSECLFSYFAFLTRSLPAAITFTVANAYKDNVWFIPAANVTISKAEPLRAGFSEVYTGYYGALPVAIKTVTGFYDFQDLKMTKSVAALWHTLNHSNITRLYGVSVDERSNPMLIIERAETSLHSRLYCENGEKPVSKDVKMRWILQIALALEYLHGQKNPVIHADLNPRNVLIGYDGIAKITDFGLSRCLNASHTFSRQSHGATRYAPPESFARWYQATTAHDVYSFAMTIYEILSEVQPFDDADNLEVIPKWVRDGERPESKPDKIPKNSWEWSLIQACWDQDPTKRPSFEEIVKIIQDRLDLFVEQASKNATKVPQDYSKTIELLSNAAKQGSADAQANLELMYANDIGVQNTTSPLSNEKTDTALFASSALATKDNLGLMYANGRGVYQDSFKAIELHTLAANQGDAAGQFNLGFMYDKGKGITQDYSKAVEWFIPATDININKAEPLGNGGFGVVYAGYYGTNSVAIKTITGLGDREAAVKMAISEAGLWYFLKHPNIAPLYGVSVDEHRNPMLIIERAETSLSSRLYCTNKEKLSKEVKMRWILQIAQAFKYLHAKTNPVIHADLKPCNVLLGYDGIARITDFGLSRCLNTSHTFSRQTQGTMRYAPPESYDRKYKATTACDVYSFAMTIYEILSEVQPFDDAARPEVIPTWVRDGERPESKPDKIPENSWEWSLIKACWDQDPTKRPSFEEIVKTIQKHSDIPKLGPTSFSLSKSTALLSISSTVPATTTPAFSKEKTDRTLVESFAPAKSADDPSELARLGMMYKDGTGVHQDYSKAVQLLSKAANEGNAQAQYNLGVMHYYGNGVNQNFPKAVELLTLAAYQGLASAQSQLGTMYTTGKGVGQDYTKAVEWYTLAANQGHATGQFDLATMYLDGKGVTQDYSKAVELFTFAACEGDASAQSALGLRYEYGQGVVQDYTEAVEWYTLASNQGHPNGQFKLGLMYRDGKGVYQNYQKAFELITLAANQGFADAQSELGYSYHYGKGVVQDYTKAVEWYTLAANQGHAHVQFILGTMYRDGKGVAQDYSRAVEWFTLAANQGDDLALSNLGDSYRYGKGVVQDYTKAVEWYTLAANRGHANAQFNLGTMYRDGEGVAKDNSKAVEWFTLAANQGDADAQSSLGFMYECGLGVVQDYPKALKWYTVAAKQGNIFAQNKLV